MLNATSSGLGSPGYNTAIPCRMVSGSLDSRRVSFGSVEVFGTPEIARSLDDTEAFRKLCKRKGVPFYNAQPDLVVDTSGSSPARMFPIFGFLFSPAQAIPISEKVDIPASTAHPTSAPPVDDLLSIHQSPVLSHASSSEAPSLSAYSPSTTTPRSILKSRPSYKTSSPNNYTSQLGAGGMSDGNSAGSGHSFAATLLAIGSGNGLGPHAVGESGLSGLGGSGLYGSDGACTAQLPPRPTPRRSLLRQAVQKLNVQQQQHIGADGGEGSEERLQGAGGMAAAVEGVGESSDYKNGRIRQHDNDEGEGFPVRQNLLLNSPPQVMSPNSSPPRLRPYHNTHFANNRSGDAWQHQRLLDSQQRLEGEEEWEEEYEEPCSSCPWLQSLCFGGSSGKSARYVLV